MATIQDSSFDDRISAESGPQRLPRDSAGKYELGPDAWRFLKVLLLFHEVGIAFREGARSLADVVAVLEEHDLSGQNKYEVCCSPASVTRQCKVARIYFGQVFGTGGMARLFKEHGPGNAIDGLTPLGERAWELTHRLLVSHRMAD